MPIRGPGVANFMVLRDDPGDATDAAHDSGLHSHFGARGAQVDTARAAYDESVISEVIRMGRSRSRFALRTKSASWGTRSTR